LRCCGSLLICFNNLPQKHNSLPQSSFSKHQLIISTMQLTNFFAILALTIVGASAAPGGYGSPPPPPPKPSPPMINHQVNYCSSGSPYCCSPSNGDSGTTCVLSTTQCNSVSICCNNAATDGSASQSCTSTSSLQQPVIFV